MPPFLIYVLGLLTVVLFANPKDTFPAVMIGIGCGVCYMAGILKGLSND